MRRLLILRPEPGAGATARDAAARGLGSVIAPLFAVVPTVWDAPTAVDHDALMLTSANAIRHAGVALGALAALPVFAVGAATAAAAVSAGLKVTHVGRGDALSLTEAMVAAGVHRPLHLTGADHRVIAADGMTMTRRIVYRSVAAEALPEEAGPALTAGAVALLHSPRAGVVFAALTDRAGIERARIDAAAISTAAAEALGAGWGRVAIAVRPTDDALLAAAAPLCEERRDRSGAPA